MILNVDQEVDGEMLMMLSIYQWNDGSICSLWIKDGQAANAAEKIASF